MANGNESGLADLGHRRRHGGGGRRWGGGGYWGGGYPVYVDPYWLYGQPEVVEETVRVIDENTEDAEAEKLARLKVALKAELRKELGLSGPPRRGGGWRQNPYAVQNARQAWLEASMPYVPTQVFSVSPATSGFDSGDWFDDAPGEQGGVMQADEGIGCVDDGAMDAETGLGWAFATDPGLRPRRDHSMPDAGYGLGARRQEYSAMVDAGYGLGAVVEAVTGAFSMPVMLGALAAGVVALHLARK